MDMTQYAESRYLTAEKINESETKKGKIVSDVEEVDGKYGKQAELTIEIDGLKKKWKPNAPSVQNIIPVWGSNSTNWLGKEVSFVVGATATGKVSIIGTPVVIKTEQV